MSLSNYILDYLFIDNVTQLSLLVGIVIVAGIVRGCIGFGLSALIIASTSFWLDVKYVVVMVMFMEVIASLFMLRNVKSEIDYKLLKILSISGIITSFIGVWVLVNINHTPHQILLSVYLVFVVGAVLANFQFKKPINDFRLYVIGSIGGFYNGFAAIGGVFVASMLSSSQVQVKNIRATMVVYFFLVEAAFFVSAYLNNIITTKVFITGLVLTFPMLFGIFIGSKLFAVLSEQILKQIVLLALLVLSVIGLFKVLI